MIDARATSMHLSPLPLFVSLTAILRSCYCLFRTVRTESATTCQAHKADLKLQIILHPAEFSHPISCIVYLSKFHRPIYVTVCRSSSFYSMLAWEMSVKRKGEYHSRLTGATNSAKSAESS